MGLNVSIDYTSQFENRESLKNAARNILNKNGATTEATQKIIEKTIFEGDKQLKELYTNPQLSVMKASAQITMSKSLKETLKYLKTQANKKIEKKPVFGELWEIVSTTNQETEQNPYKGELLEFEIDKNLKNIFAA